MTNYKPDFIVLIQATDLLYETIFVAIKNDYFCSDKHRLEIFIIQRRFSTNNFAFDSLVVKNFQSSILQVLGPNFNQSMSCVFGQKHQLHCTLAM